MGLSIEALWILGVPIACILLSSNKAISAIEGDTAIRYESHCHLIAYVTKERESAS